ncbi:hypothetical protein ACN28S_08075 [Cystobacter fuscus]
MFQFSTRLISRSLLTVSIALAGCGGTEMDDAEQVSDAQQEDIGQVESAACGHCDNCVLHARCLAPRLPYGLTSWSDKVAVINSSTAHAGCVAMILLQLVRPRGLRVEGERQHHLSERGELEGRRLLHSLRHQGWPEHPRLLVPLSVHTTCASASTRSARMTSRTSPAYRFTVNEQLFAWDWALGRQ